jgi:hypothetical protein
VLYAFSFSHIIHLLRNITGSKFSVSGVCAMSLTLSLQLELYVTLNFDYAWFTFLDICLMTQVGAVRAASFC